MDEGFVIVDPNPQEVKGVNHYYTDPDEDSEHNGNWSSDKEDAIIFPTELEAKQRLKVLKRKKDCHFRSTKAENLYIKEAN